jgi:predicted DCC family thiol-disulfide oxidoreductase YuxK
MEAVQPLIGPTSGSPAFEDPLRNVIMFDGVCNLCHGFVNFVIDHDPACRWRFTALQTRKGRQLLQQFNLPTALLTVIVIEDGVAYQRSTAALRVLRTLSSPWHLLYWFIIVPRFLRDFVYGLVAASRYSVFGQTDACKMPTKAVKERFLDWAILEEELPQALDKHD